MLSFLCMCGHKGCASSYILILILTLTDDVHLALKHGVSYEQLVVCGTYFWKVSQYSRYSMYRCQSPYYPRAREKEKQQKQKK